MNNLYSHNTQQGGEDREKQWVGTHKAKQGGELSKIILATLSPKQTIEQKKTYSLLLRQIARCSKHHNNSIIFQLNVPASSD